MNQSFLRHTRSINMLLDPGEEVDEFNCKEIVKELNSYDSLGIRLEDREVDDKTAYDSFRRNVSHNQEDHQYTVGWPWKEGTLPKD